MPRDVALLEDANKPQPNSMLPGPRVCAVVRASRPHLGLSISILGGFEQGQE